MTSAQSFDCLTDPGKNSGRYSLLLLNYRYYSHNSTYTTVFFLTGRTRRRVLPYCICQNLVKITRILTADEGLIVHEINFRCGTLQPDCTTLLYLFIIYLYLHYCIIGNTFPDFYLGMFQLKNLCS